MIPREDLPVVVIGAGPVGLAAAAHLVSRGLRPLVVEAGDDVAANVRSWGHVRLFSPWRYDVDRAARALLEAEGWTAPDDDAMPTGTELVERYLRPLARVPAIASGIRLRSRVVAITRRDFDLVRTKNRGHSRFVVRVTEGGLEKDIEARAVIDASGTWGSPNPLGASGLPAHGENAVRDLIAYGIPDVLGVERSTYAGRTTLVVGAGHSAANAILALAELAKTAPGTRIVWATRGADLKRAFGGGAADGLPARGQLGSDLRSLVDAGALTLVTGFRIHAIRMVASSLAVVGTRDGVVHTIEGVERIVAATGQRPDLSILRELRVELDPALECARALGPLIDPNEHSCGTVRPHGAVELAHPEPDFYVIGNKSYGRAPTFLLATGYEQARSVVAMLAGDREAAMRVELDLPETGVCEVGPAAKGSCCAPTNAAQASCCG
jgi:hypothetical protein